MCNIEKLSEKARQRNPDEFYHKMINATIKDGEHHTIQRQTSETKKNMKLDQLHDLALVGLKRQVEKNKADKLQSNLHLIDFGNKQNQHIFFVNDVKEVKGSLVKLQ